MVTNTILHTILFKEPIKTLSVNEIAKKKHRVYLTNFLDVEREKVGYIADGKDANTFTLFKERYIQKRFSKRYKVYLYGYVSTLPSRSKKTVPKSKDNIR